MRHLELSLDRSRWEGLPALRTYLRANLTPERVLTCPLFRFPEAVSASPSICESPVAPYTILRKIYLRLLSTIGIYYLESKEVLQCACLLQKMQEVLAQTDIDYGRNHEMLRVNIATMAYDRLKDHSRKRDLKKANYIEQYWHAEWIEHTSLEEYWNSQHKDYR